MCRIAYNLACEAEGDIWT